jgi:hypothetical protein
MGFISVEVETLFIIFVLKNIQDLHVNKEDIDTSNDDGRLMMTRRVTTAGKMKEEESTYVLHNYFALSLCYHLTT